VNNLIWVKYVFGPLTFSDFGISPFWNFGPI